MRLTSLHNPLLKSIRRAVARGRPTEEGFVIAEGPHLLSEALRSSWQIEKILSTESAFNRHRDLLASAQSDRIEITPEALAAVADTETSQGLLTLLRPFTWTWSELLDQLALVVVLDGIQDPGNAGTIVRSAEAFGGTGVVFLKGSVHMSNPKFLRAAAGSIFRVPYLEGIETHRFLAQAEESALNLYALSPTAKQTLTGTDFVRPIGLAVGAEGSGLSPELSAACKPVVIPTERVESLNAAVSMSIALFEAYKQRGMHESL